MTNPDTFTLCEPQTLVCHPATPCALPLRLEVRVAHVLASGEPRLCLRYELQGPLEDLSIPPAACAGPADGLWQHTCFEAFVGTAADPAYREFNFSPSGQWAAYRFSDERVRDLPGEARQHAAPPQVRLLQWHDDRLVLEGWLALQSLPGSGAASAHCLGLSAVIETRAGQLSYWALNHPAARPDFHQASARSLRLAWPTPSTHPTPAQPS